MNQEKVLDNGHVELVDCMGSDLTVANAARVSFASESKFEIDHGGMPVLKERDVKLIRYLAKHNHWTPFAHPQITLRIKAPGSDGWLECIDGGGETSGGFATHPLYESYKHLMNQAERVYEELIASNVAPEQARFALPQSMYTEWFWTGSLAAYARFYKQRIDEHAQWEIQQYANAVGKIIEPLFPVSWNELTK